jgi:hypothetical protein
MRLVTMLAMTLALVACGGKKDKDGGGGTTGSSAGSSTNAGTGSAATGSAATGSAATGSDTGSAAGSAAGSATAEGSGAGSGAGSGSDAPLADVKDSGVKFGEKLPEGWFATGAQLDYVEAVNESQFPADNAHFVFDYGIDDPTLPKDPKEYRAALEKGLGGEKIIKEEKLANGYYYETAQAFWYVIDAGDKRIHCDGSLYKDSDYEKIAKIRDKVVATAKKICASAKL